MNLKVLFETQIHGSFSSLSSLDAYVYRNATLPFAPFVGLEVSDGDWGATVASVWVRDGKVICFCEDDKEIYTAQLHKQPHRTVDEIVAEYVKDGWTREEAKDA